MKKYQKDFLKHLVKSGALEFGKFELKSGRISPYFVNIAKAMNNGRYASETGNAYASEIAKGQIDLKIDYIHGPAYKGIPLSVMISNKIWDIYCKEIRWGYDRKEEKKHGDMSEKELIGDIEDGDGVIIVDDVITTGKTKIDNWKRLERSKNGLKCKGILVAVDRQEIDENGNITNEILKNEGLPVFSILKITEIFKYLYKRPIDGKIYVDRQIKKSFDEYFEEYGANSE